jgi:protease-4
MSKSTKWFLGILGVLLLFAAGFFFLMFSFTSFAPRGTETVISGSGDRIALVELLGEIQSSEEFVRQVKKYSKDRSIKALLIRIDSPGGAVVPSQEMYEELRKTREGGKPVVVSMGSLAASGGYYVACGGTELVANRGSLTGSIGVISEFLQLRGAMDKLGIGMKTIKSGQLKDAGSPTRAMTEEDQKYFQQLIDDVKGQFMDVVIRERKLPRQKVLALADGRVFTGEQAVKVGLVDTIGTYEDALRITGKLAGISGEPAVVRERKRVSFWNNVFGDVGDAVKDLKQVVLHRPVLSYRYDGPY